METHTQTLDATAPSPLQLTPRPCPSCLEIMPGTPLARQVTFNEGLDFVGRKKGKRSPWEWLCCPECELDYVCLAPPAEWVEKIYAASGETNPELDALAAQTAMDLWTRLMPTGRRSALEIGCGRGSFLEKIKKQGLRVLGTEPNQTLRKKSNLPPGEIVSSADLFENPPTAAFDVLILQLSLEHLQTPLQDLQAVRRFLKSNSHILIQYHDGVGLPHQFLGGLSPLWDIQHLQIFNASAMKKFIERLGATVLIDEAYVNDYPLAYWSELLGLKWPRWMRELGAKKIKIPAGNRVMLAQFQKNQK